MRERTKEHKDEKSNASHNFHVFLLLVWCLHAVLCMDSYMNIFPPDFDADMMTERRCCVIECEAELEHLDLMKIPLRRKESPESDVISRTLSISDVYQEQAHS